MADLFFHTPLRPKFTRRPHRRHQNRRSRMVRPRGSRLSRDVRSSLSPRIHRLRPARPRYSVSTQYPMAQLFRAFLLKALHGWSHETALVEYLQQRPSLGEQLGSETLPDQSTLWRTWNQRFTTEVQETIQKAAQTILVKAEMAGVDVPRSPPRTINRLDENDEDTALNDQEVLSKTDKVVEEIQRVAYPSFSLHRGESREIHTNSFWDLQTYLGLRENLAANEGARSFTLESDRERTPLGHTHRSSLRELSIGEVRGMYREAVGRLIDRLAETNEFYRAGTVAIDITEDDPFTGDRAGHESEIIGTKEKTDEYAYQWATVQLVGNAVPLVLDARPVRKGDTRLEIVRDLLDSAEEMVMVDDVLMDREFDSQHVLEEISSRRLQYVVPKRMRTSEKETARQLCEHDIDRQSVDRGLHLGDDEWHETTLVYRRKENSEHTDYRQYSVFMTNYETEAIGKYGSRWEIESGYKSIKRFMAATTSKNFVLRFFYFAFACLLYSIWRSVDLLVQVELAGEYDRPPVVTANSVLTLLKKQTGIG
ncbi:transposase family protein (plasmid) [Halogeometricum borinquense DSM 11551]|uniref:Transposase family protein n=2 Tax=Halogeometricum borinquense (strain ATCC 700274 / DSM 11551 / JCM 10706 / KCTC 4070 / PR3) TaxID=469382 RepID=E4NWM5_HALBP|nr:transposase family protein [Halogeometricum borinquense DSM 11551]